ncbi:MAG TPA: plasmid pRiA4b ORF-3 family protein [Candidatus Eisenbergiella stercorigallinarum]|uniref:Plasmid pRiA4b ORF-3 family protein n=1 Tax=Candidatus Eisenbergiella stercorigallinarum TaxID=2838557 RepID=A0A9D2U081_9FIRM|nr:plasmid pRiA4b ORF-3 family protein [Candidatus Eisenbergiella stercorigallinarum]
MGSLKLKKGRKFSYLFDFGDSWWFEIKVLKLLEERVEQPEIIRSEKAAPKQYPDWEE